MMGRAKRMALLLGLLLLLSVPGAYAVWSYYEPMAPVQSSSDVSMQPFIYGDIYIVDMNPANQIQMSAATQIAITTDRASTVNSDVTFYNSTNDMYMYYGTTAASGLSCDTDVGRNFFNGKERMTIATSVTTTGRTSNAKVDYHFARVDGVIIRVTKGNTADNIDSLMDGYTKLDYVNSHRWTNWASNTSGVGVAAELNLVAEEAFTLDQIALYHFLDSGAGNKNNNFRGSCDLPESVSIYYFDSQTGAYVELLGYTKTVNYSSPSRSINNYGYGVYNITIDGQAVTLDASYSGAAPKTTYTLASSITTQAIKIVLRPKADYILGLMEMQFLNDGTALTIQ